MNNLNLLLMKTDYYMSITEYKNNDEYENIIRNKINNKWVMLRKAIYFNVINKNQEIPEQGWKIHISASLSNVNDILDKVSNICIQNNASFKFLLDSNVFILSLSKSYPRESSGKFITIYPSNLSEFKLLMGLLYVALKGYSGPYILSDRRYKDCKVLYYRYGGIKGTQILNHDGKISYAIKAPNGSLQLDYRMPYFSLPEWELDPFNTEEEQGEATLKNGRYNVLEPLMFNNSGGIYLAYDNERKENVVIKEARPHTLQGVHKDVDAIDFKRKEFEIFKSLKEENITPKAYDSFYEWEHFFIVVSLIDGKLLREFLVEKSPLINPDLPKREVSIFLSSIEIIWRNIINNLLLLHNKNIFLCDFSIGNFFIKEDMSIIFSDLDGAFRVDRPELGMMYSKGYIDPLFIKNETFTIENELYGIGCLFFSTLSTYNNLLEIDEKFVDKFLSKMQREINLPNKYIVIIKSLMNDNPKERLNLHEILKILNENKMTDSNYYISYNTRLSSEENIKSAIPDITKFISYTANENKEYLFYTDSRISNSLNVENGAVGVLYALNKINKHVPSKYIKWVKKQEISKESYPPSLYLGLSGISWGLYLLNEIEYAHHLLSLVNSHPLKYVSSDVYTGLAGIGLTNLFFWKETKSQTYIDEAVSSADYLIKSAQVNGDTLSWLAPDGNTYIGHAKGASGIAVFLMYMYKVTHDEKYLSASKKALNFEISFAIEKENFISFPGKTQGSLTYSPYWFSGSAGVGAALMRYKYLTKETEFDNMIEKIISDSNRIYTLFPGLFNGLAGLGNLFLDAEQFLEESKYRENALKICDSLNMFTLERKQGLAFPGDYVATINCDFGSGSSGIALFLNRLIKRENNFNFYIDEFLY